MTPTPGSANGAGVAEPQVADTTFSVDRGFYDATFDVEITTATAGSTIRYTTDFSWPTESTGTIYSGPISITTTTVLRAIAYKTGLLSTNVDTQTYIYLADVINQPVSPPGWPTDSASWDGFTPDYEMDPAVVSAYSAEIIDDLRAMPTMALTL